MTKKILSAIMIFATLIFSGCGEDKKIDSDKNKLVIYTATKEELVDGIVEGFKKQNPNIEVECKIDGAGKIMEQIANDYKETGHVRADIIWTSEISDFYRLKEESMLEKYKPANFDELLNPFTDYDGSFTAVRLTTLGIVINTNKIKNEPTSWEDLFTNPEFENSFGLADPELSGTSYMSVALLEKKFGWEFFERLRENGAVKVKSSKKVIDETAEGKLSACLGVDYIANGKIEKGEPLKICYPKELVAVPSPVAIFRESQHKDEAKKFVDYLMTEEAQQKIADTGSVPVRKNIQMPKKYNLPTPEDAMTNGIKANYFEILTQKENLLKKFNSLFR